MRYPVLILALWLLPALAAAQAVVSTGRSFVEARLLSGHADDAGVRTAGLELTIAPGWKTYWRSPGETGVPPRFDWAGSGNLAAVEVLWPVPIVFESFGMETIGYDRRVTLPLRLTPEDPAQPIRLRLTAMLGVCHDICVFEEVSLSRDLEPGDRQGAGLVRLAERRLPLSGSEAGIGRVTCRIEGTGAARGFTARLDLAAPMPGATVLLEAPGEAWFTEARTRAATDSLAVSARLNLVDAGGWVARDAIRFTVLAGERSAEITGCQSAE